MRSSLKWAGVFGGVLFFLSQLSGCGAAGPRTFTGAGSQWTLTLTPATSSFALTQAGTLGGAVDVTVAGTYRRYSTGFTYFTVTSASGTGAPAVGDTTYGVESYNALMVLKPFSGGALIPLVIAGACPSSSISRNFMTLKTVSGWTSAGLLNGIFAYDTTSLAASLSTRYALATTTTDAGALSLGTGTCASGTFSNTGGSSGGTGEVFLTSAGASVVHVNSTSTTADYIVVGLPVPSALSIANLAGAYAGMVYEPGGVAVNQAVTATLTAGSASASGPVYPVSDVGTGAHGTTGYLLTLDSAGVSLGFVNGNIDLHSATGGGVSGEVRSMVCAAHVGGGFSTKNILLCGASDSSGGFYSWVFIGS